MSTAKLVKSWSKDVSSCSNKDPTLHDKLNDNEQRQREFRQLSHPTVDKIIRVNQAGERAAVMIYAGQSAVLGNSEVGNCIQVTYKI